jgi:DNA-binding MarR family transcriptional regulator
MDKDLDQAHNPRSHEYWLPSLKAFLSYRLSMLSRVLDQAHAGNVPKKIHVSVTEGRVLDHLSLERASTVRGLADEMCLDKAQVSRAVANLVKLDYASRAVDSDDRRSIKFLRTPLGDKIYRENFSQIQNGQSDLLAVLDPEELEVLDRAIEKMMRYARPDD